MDICPMFKHISDAPDFHELDIVLIFRLTHPYI